MNKKFTYSCVLAVLLLLIFSANFLGALFIDFMQNKYAETSSVPLEVVFVTAEKDFEVLPYSVASVRKYLKQPITKFVLVAKKTQKALDLAKSLNLNFIDENDIIDLAKLKAFVSDNNFILKGSLTWYYQQFLKLAYHEKAATKYYFVIDADIVLTKPLILVSDYGVHNFFIGENIGHGNYKASIEAILGNKQFIPDFSFVADMMCFDKDVVMALINYIENKFRIPFYKAAITVE
jgi:hypothetical protein